MGVWDMITGIIYNILFVLLVILQCMSTHHFHLSVHFIIIRPHRSTTYADAACCYRPRSVVCRSVCHSSEPCKTAEPIEMPFGLRTCIDQGTMY